MLLALLLATAAVQAAEQQVVFVDLDHVFNEHPKTKRAYAQLKDFDNEYQKERETLLDEYDKMQETLTGLRAEAQNTLLSEDVRTRKKAEWEEMLIEIREFESKVKSSDELQRKRLQDKSERMLKDVVASIRESLEAYARKQGYGAVIDSSGKTLNRVECVLFVDPKLDITDAFLAVVMAEEAGTP